MNGTDRVRIAIQKRGRLADASRDLLAKCGLDVAFGSDRLVTSSQSFPLDVMMLRDDDIPSYVRDGICELGIVGQNVLEELLAGSWRRDDLRVLEPLGFGRCRLSIAAPRSLRYATVEAFAGARIATSYPNLLQQYLERAHVDARIVPMHGSVESAPALGLADAICDLVQTGSTLHANGLAEVAVVLESEGVLLQTSRPLTDGKLRLIRRLEQRIASVTRAAGAKYVMMNAPRTALDAIYRIMPGMESPSVIPLGSDGTRVAIHAVARETDFWAMIERLKDAGASSILMAPIEKILD